MGISGSKHCKENMVNPEFLSVITLTDSMVQRLPLDIDSSGPLDREAREQNIDDFWKERMKCMENAFSESLGITEGMFVKMERRILGMSPAMYKPKCALNVRDVNTCFLTNRNDPMKCDHLVKKFLLCIDTTLQDELRRAYLNAERAKKKRGCK